MCKNFFVKPGNFFCRKLENDRMSFLDQCNFETVGFESGFIPKIFKGDVFGLLGNSFG